MQGRIAAITLGSRMDVAGGRPAGFDYMRLILSVLVIAIHASVISYGASADAALWRSGWQTPMRMVLPMFFALSGFLVAGSFARSRTLAMFLGLRVVRIFPALVAEIVLSALILGPMLTTLPLRAYFSDPLFARYLRNMLGDPQYLLPGVFAANPFPDLVNYQLWTVPFELFCYLSLAAAALVGARRRPILLPCAALAMTLGYAVVRVLRNGGVLELTRPVPGPMLVICFLAGVCAYLYRHRLPAGPIVGALCAVAAFASLALPGYAQFLAPWPIAYATAFLGTLDPGRSALIRGADYSYGIYLYGFPLQQTVASLGDETRSAPVNFILALTGAALFAALSWRFVERPALRLRVPMKAIEDRWLGRDPRWRAARRIAPTTPGDPRVADE